jgi:hypothetical protein
VKVKLIPRSTAASWSAVNRSPPASATDTKLLQPPVRVLPQPTVSQMAAFSAVLLPINLYSKSTPLPCAC